MLLSSPAFLQSATTVAGTGSSNCSRRAPSWIDERLGGSGLIVFSRGGCWLVGDADSKCFLYRVPALRIPSRTLPSRNRHSFSLAALDISRARLFRHVDKLSEINRWARTADNNDNDKRVNNTPTYPCLNGQYWWTGVIVATNRAWPGVRTVANSEREMRIPDRDPGLIGIHLGQERSRSFRNSYLKNTSRERTCFVRLVWIFQLVFFQRWNFGT